MSRSGNRKYVQACIPRAARRTQSSGVLAVVADSDTRFVAAVMQELRERRVAAIVAHDYATAMRLLADGPLPSVLYVGAAVRPLTGADLLADIERNERLAGVPMIAVVPPDSLLAIALKRGGVHTLEGAPDAVDAATLIANIAVDATQRRREERQRIGRMMRHVAGIGRRARLRAAWGRRGSGASWPPSSPR